MIHTSENAINAPADNCTACRPNASRAARATVKASPTSVTSGSSQAFKVSQERCNVSVRAGRRRTPTRHAARIIGQTANRNVAFSTSLRTSRMPIMSNMAPAAASNRQTHDARQRLKPRWTALRHAARNIAG
ncbi:hypothetical protein D3C73_1115520 [compost metagenome]